MADESGDRSALVERLTAEIRRRADLVGADESQTVTFGRGGSGTPGLFVDAAGHLHWGVEERGRTLEDRATQDPDELLYWAFLDTTLAVARRWEATHRTPAGDHRIAVLRKQGELLRRLDPAWQRRWRADLVRAEPRLDALLPALPGADVDPPAIR